MKLSQSAQVVTAVSVQGGWVKVLQSRVQGKDSITLLGMKARSIQGLSEEAISQALKDLVLALPVFPQEVIGLFSSDAVLTRYLQLPSHDPAELQAMALYQLEGMLPFPLQECVTSVKALGPAGEATRVLVAAVHRPNVERLLRICRRAGLSLISIASSSEAIGRWHQVCQPGATGVKTGWLVAELSPEGLDLGVLVRDSLVYMRHVPYAVSNLGELIARLEETITAYQTEQVGPPVRQVTLSGSLDFLGPSALEQLEATMGLPVRSIDPLLSSPFRNTLALAAQEIAPEVSFSELLGVACAPRLLELDLLPLDTRLQQARQAFVGEIQRAALLAGCAALLVLAWAGFRVGINAWQMNQVQSEISLLTPQVERVKGMAGTVREVRAARAGYIHQSHLLADAMEHLLPGMTLQFLGLETGKGMTLRGTAPKLEAVTEYAGGLTQQELWQEVTLRSARVQAELSNVEFEIVLQPRSNPSFPPSVVAEGGLQRELSSPRKRGSDPRFREDDNLR